MARPSESQRRYQRERASVSPRINVVQHADTITDRRRARIARMMAIMERNEHDAG